MEEVTANASSAITAPSCLIAFVEDVEATKMSNDDEDQERDCDDEWGDKDVELTVDLSALRVPVYADSFKRQFICSLPVPYVRDQRDSWHQRGISFHLRSN